MVSREVRKMHGDIYSEHLYMTNDSPGRLCHRTNASGSRRRTARGSKGPGRARQQQPPVVGGRATAVSLLVDSCDVNCRRVAAYRPPRISVQRGCRDEQHRMQPVDKVEEESFP
jgi:hypothetical protein